MATILISLSCNTFDYQHFSIKNPLLKSHGNQVEHKIENSCEKRKPGGSIGGSISSCYWQVTIVCTRNAIEFAIMYSPILWRQLVETFAPPATFNQTLLPFIASCPVLPENYVVSRIILQSSTFSYHILRLTLFHLISIVFDSHPITACNSNASRCIKIPLVLFFQNSLLATLSVVNADAIHTRASMSSYYCCHCSLLYVSQFNRTRAPWTSFLLIVAGLHVRWARPKGIEEWSECSCGCGCDSYSDFDGGPGSDFGHSIYGWKND